MDLASTDTSVKRWFIMRDLKRTNAKEPAYKLLEKMGIEVYIVKQWQIVIKKGKRIREEKPIIQDLVFVHETREKLDPIVAKNPTLQYRWLRHAWREPMTVRELDMERFIYAVETSEKPKYYLPDELTPSMYGRDIEVIGGPFNGYSGKLLTIRGSKIKRLLVELPGFMSVGVEIEPEYIKF